MRVDLHPSTGLSKVQHDILEDMGLDGHWLYTTVIGWVTPEFFDLDQSLPERHAVEAGFIEHVMPDLLADALITSVLKENHDEGDFRKLDEYIDENGSELYQAAQEILVYVLELLANFQTSPHLKCRTPENYLVGYSTADGYSGLLHFNFVDQ